jgi:ribosome biogenesis GTPase
MIEGVVTKSTGSWYSVRDKNEKVYQCRTAGKLRLGDLKSTNPIAVGDNVKILLENEEEGQIKEVLPRKNYVVRQSPRKKHNVHLIAANIDQALLITTMTKPDVKTGFIDRFLMMTQPYDIPVTIVFNKWDLYSQNDIDAFHFLKDIYTKIGYEVIASSVVDLLGIEDIKTRLKGKVTLISGQSGVGKSSLINSIEPSMEIKTMEISDYSGKGQHTTTFAEMLPLTFGGSIIDTPGIKTLGFNHFELLDVAHNFKEIFITSDQCKYNNCMHRNEPKCAVKEAVESGEISDLRYSSYLQLLDEVEDQNYWERHKDI